MEECPTYDMKRSHPIKWCQSITSPGPLAEVANAARQSFFRNVRLVTNIHLSESLTEDTLNYNLDNFGNFDKNLNFRMLTVTRRL
jgi:hypothetical protein